MAADPGRINQKQTQKLRIKRFAPKTRSGCVICRERRVKCDESKPSCNRCNAASRACKYEDTKRKPRRTDVLLIAPSPVVFSTPTAIPQFSASMEIRDLIHLIPRVVSKDNRPMGRGECYDKMLSFCQRLEAFIFELPMRSGHVPVLDSAVACVAAGLRWRVATRAQEPALERIALGLYGDTLKQLQPALVDSKESLSSDTLCATQLLFLFETLSRDNRTALVYHAAGASRLIEHRGPGRFNSQFDRSLLIAHAPISIMESFFNEKHSTLESESWQGVFRAFSPKDFGFSPIDEPLVSSLAMRSACPGLICDWKLLFNKYMDDDLKRKSLLTRTGKYIKKTNQWLTRWRDYLFNPQGDDGTKLTEIRPGEDRHPGRCIDGVLLQEFNLLMAIRIYVSLGGPESTALELRGQQIARETLVGHKLENRTCYGVVGNLAQHSAMEICANAAGCFQGDADAWLETARSNDLRAKDGLPTKLAPASIVLEYISNI